MIYKENKKRNRRENAISYMENERKFDYGMRESKFKSKLAISELCCETRVTINPRRNDNNCVVHTSQS